jgi:hypothetical protein
MNNKEKNFNAPKKSRKLNFLTFVNFLINLIIITFIPFAYISSEEKKTKNTPVYKKILYFLLELLIIFIIAYVLIKILNK